MSDTQAPEASASMPDSAHTREPGVSEASLPGRSLDLRVARVHMRAGSLTLARAEFEAFAGSGQLDDDALLDLAEVRWRTGDLSGAGDAANAYLSAGHEDPLAFVIAAESIAALGRPGEARRLAGRALELTDGSLDGLFAGMPRSAIWPDEAADRGEPAGTLFGESPDGPAVGPASAAEWGRVEAGTLWDHAAGAGLAQAEDLDGVAALEAGRSALEAGDDRSAALHFSVALRVTPGLAPAVLEIIGSRPGPELGLVRGDAYRLVGHEMEARRALAEAARLIGDGQAEKAGPEEG